MSNSARKDLDNNGFCFIPNHEPSINVIKIALDLGSPYSAHGSEPLDAVEHLRPNVQEDSKKLTYSSLFGFAAFPFHSDKAHTRKPPHYVMLRCIVGYPEVSTLLIDVKPIIESLGRTVLHRSLMGARHVVPGRRCLRMLDFDDNSSWFRWDDVFLEPISAAAIDACKMVRQYLVNANATRACLGQAGDTLIIDNWRMLHGRTEVPLQGQSREIVRLYLEKVY